MACQIKRDNNNNIIEVLAPNGKPSILYDTLKSKLVNPTFKQVVTTDKYVSSILDTEYFKDNSNEEIALAAWSKAYTANFVDSFGNWKADKLPNTDINGEPLVDTLFQDNQVKPGVESATFDKQLAQKIQDKLQALYPEIKLNITNNPVWEKGNNIFNQEQFNLEVNYRLKTTKVVLDNYNKIRQWESNKSIDQDTLYRKIGELGISKQQLDLLRDSEGSTIEEKLASFISTYSYTIEVNTATTSKKIDTDSMGFFTLNDFQYNVYKGIYGSIYTKRPVINGETSYEEKDLIYITKDEYEKADKQLKKEPTQYYSTLTVPGGTNYRENEIATPAITPSIKGHGEFATNKGIGWFRSDDEADKSSRRDLSDEELFNAQMQELEEGMSFSVKKQTGVFTKGTKTRRILELQSDLFQKGRDKEILESPNERKATQEDIDSGNLLPDVEVGNLIEDYKTITKGNKFLQLLNKNNNWVNFFVKAVVQDSAEKGYEKVLFPTGDTASKVEGHTTLEEFKKQKEGRIKELEFKKSLRPIENSDGTWDVTSNKGKQGYKFDSKERAIAEIEKTQDLEKIDTEIEQLKQELERIEAEGFGALKPIYNFYENTVANVLKKQGYNPKTITDEYGNTWNEVNINQARDLSEILLQRNKANQIIGQANIKALTVLIDAVNQKQDTLPHEYAHHYISWYKNTPIVQEAIKKWGSEEALVQAIGEQVVKQKGEAYNWWNNFVKWILNQFNKLSTLQKEELTQILTDAFLTRQNLNTTQFIKPVQKANNWTNVKNNCPKL